MSAAAPVFNPFLAPEYDFAAVQFPYPCEPESEVEQDSADGFVFNITLRKADGCAFGIATTPAVESAVLHIDGILPGGAAEAWNRQCASSGAAEKMLLPGDCIVSVNGVSGAEDMTTECESQVLLRTTVVRSEGPRSAPPTHVAAVPDKSEFSSPLRADASEFVPPTSTLSPDAAAFSPFSAQAAEFVPLAMQPSEVSMDAPDFLTMASALPYSMDPCANLYAQYGGF